MHQPGRVVQKKGLVLGLSHEAERIFGHFIPGEPLRVHPVRIAGLVRGEPGQPVGVHFRVHSAALGGDVKAVIFRLGIGIVIDGDVPLAAVTGPVPVGVEQLGDGRLLDPQPAHVPGIDHPVPLRVFRSGGLSSQDVGPL